MTKSVVMNTRVPPSVVNVVKEAIDRGEYLSVADYLRQALREKTEREKEDS